MLEIRGLHKIYGKYHALSGLDMNVATGALYGFVGPNGAGKTTTIKIMTGLLPAEEGKITIDGMDALSNLKALKARIGYVPDFFGVYDNLTVSEYMEFFASCYNTRDFYQDFADSLSLLDEVILVDIYPAREASIPGVTSKLIYDNLRPGIEKSMCKKEEILNILKDKNIEVLITLGAGDIDNYVPEIKKELEKMKNEERRTKN